ncbi:SCO1431 family membrane protein [Streptomyces sp. NPDC102467]|uniref:SCO1431 family membrane protein n=1 Tax=Streptomyces sp. NPDC102467 TaxID=3366179 RepID=UPI00380E40C4
MTSSTAASHAPVAARTRTGGPQDGPKIVEHIVGWAFVIVLAMLVTQAGLM